MHSVARVCRAQVAHFWADVPLLASFEMLPAAYRELPGLAPAPPRPTLDLFNVHFWNWMERDDGFGPCQGPAAFWHSEKPIVFAELPAHIKSHVERYSHELLDCVLRGGFNGAMFWAFNDQGTRRLSRASLSLSLESRPEHACEHA